MAPYSQDLRSRVLRDSDAGMASKDVAAKYAVSRAWVDRVKQRKRETGETRPRVQTKFRRRALDADQEHRLGVLIYATEQRRPDVAAARRQWRATQALRAVDAYIFLDECGVTTDLLRRYGRSPRPRAVTGRRIRSLPGYASAA